MHLAKQELAASYTGYDQPPRHQEKSITQPLLTGALLRWMTWKFELAALWNAESRRKRLLSQQSGGKNHPSASKQANKWKEDSEEDLPCWRNLRANCESSAKYFTRASIICCKVARQWEVLERFLRAPTRLETMFERVLWCGVSRCAAQDRMAIYFCCALERKRSEAICRLSFSLDKV